MSLRTRITLAAAVAVAAVSLGLGTIAYFAMRAQQVDEIRQQLRERVQRPHTQGTGSRDTGTTSTHHGGAQVCVSSVAQHAPAPALGGAPGYLQSVCPNGRVVADQGGTPLLPEPPKSEPWPRKLAAASSSPPTRREPHVEILAVGDQHDHKALEIALPLTAVDASLHKMLITFGVLGTAAVILAALAGSIIARSALSPIQRLNAETRRVTKTLDHSRRLGQQGAQELQVLAASFNREAVQRAERRAPTVRFELDAEPAVIVNSPDRVDRAISNVIDNARKWGAEGGTIEVSLHDGVLTVRDHGPGFNPADLEHIFERFYRSDQARRMPGSGLGLAIVKQAAEAHGGYARATNAPDGGAVLQSPSAASTLRLASPASDQSRFAENLAAQLPRCA